MTDTTGIAFDISIGSGTSSRSLPYRGILKPTRNRSWLLIDSTGVLCARDLLSIRTSRQFQFGGPDAPTLVPILELALVSCYGNLSVWVWLRVTMSTHTAFPRFVVWRQFLERLGWTDDENGSVHECCIPVHLQLHRCERYPADPSFDGAFDIPLLMYAEEHPEILDIRESQEVPESGLHLRMAVVSPWGEIMNRGDQVRHPTFGTGEVLLDNGATVVVRFETRIEECPTADLQRVDSLAQVLTRAEFDPPVDVIARSLLCEGGTRIGQRRLGRVFSRSRIALLPHQLWVCRQVNRTRPARWLVADDVGLGKTIEAGLILLPLLATGEIRRLLVLCPASLVGQWQFRLRTMFDIRLTAYTAESDTPRADFWNTQNQVVASVHTLRLDRGDRHQRLVEADAMEDMVVVDEAHHLNADEESGPTLGYKLVEKLGEANRIGSMVFFTGTPHRGKNYGFLALLRLLRPDLFDPRKPVEDQLSLLRGVMIRNNKNEVTDLAGARLFQEPLVRSDTYSYAIEEDRFYQTLTEFILTGKAYARTLAQTEGRAVMLVLIAMQKLASSSVAAIRRALRGRLDRIVDGRRRLVELEDRLRDYREREEEGDDDVVNALVEQIAELSAQLVLMEDEEPRLRELVAVADAVIDETKVRKILELVDGPFAGRPVLFFTEYKATQSLLMSRLLQRFGPGCVTFINGDERGRSSC